MKYFELGHLNIFSIVNKRMNYWAGGMTQAVEGLPSKYEVLISNPVLPTKKTKNELLLALV
jgi:hypothetical protein